MKTMMMLVLAVVVSAVMVGCASTPNSLTGSERPVVNDKGVVMGYQAR